MNAPNVPKEITIQFAQLKKEAAIEPDKVHIGEIKKRLRSLPFMARAELVRVLRLPTYPT